MHTRVRSRVHPRPTSLTSTSSLTGRLSKGNLYNMAWRLVSLAVALDMPISYQGSKGHRWEPYHLHIEVMENTVFTDLTVLKCVYFVPGARISYVMLSSFCVVRTSNDLRHTMVLFHQTNQRRCEQGVRDDITTTSPYYSQPSDREPHTNQMHFTIETRHAVQQYEPCFGFDCLFWCYLSSE